MRASEWVAHAVGLPQYSAAFRANAVTGFDLPVLLRDGGAALRGPRTEACAKRLGVS